MSDSVRPYGQQPARLLCPWNSLGKNTGVGCQFLLQGCMDGLLPNVLTIHLILVSPSPKFVGPHACRQHMCMQSYMCMHGLSLAHIHPLCHLWAGLGPYQPQFLARCPTWTFSLWPMDCSPLGSSVHGILQARILEWVVIPFSKGSSWPRDQTRVSCLVARAESVFAVLLLL